MTDASIPEAPDKLHSAGYENNLLVDVHGAVALVTLNRPHAGNALSLSLQSALCNILHTLEADANIRAIVLHGGNGRTFCAGLDLGELERGVDLVNGTVDPVAAMAASSKPVIAAVNGAAVTGGLELVLACDFALASTAARFADTHARMDVVPGWGLSQRLSRAVGLNRALEISLTGRFIDAATARDWGLINSIHATQDLLPAALDLAAAIAAWDPGYIARYRALIRAGAQMPLDTAMALEARTAHAHNSKLDPLALSARGLRK